MKLIIAIVHDEDAYEIIEEFNENKLKITKLCSTGGFMKSGNSTLLSGVEDDEVEKAAQIIAENSISRQEIRNNHSQHILTLKLKENQDSPIAIGRATIFITNIERFVKF